MSDVVRALGLDTDATSHSPGPIFYSDDMIRERDREGDRERDREREGEREREGGREMGQSVASMEGVIQEEAWEDHLRSQLLERSLSFDGMDLATLPPLGHQVTARVGSAGGVSVGTALSQLDRSGRIMTSRRGSGVLSVSPGVPLSSATAIAARLQQGQEGREEKDDGIDLDGSDRDLGDIGRQFRSLMLLGEENKGDHCIDEYLYDASNHTGGTMSPSDGEFMEHGSLLFSGSLSASPDFTEGKQDNCHDMTPQIVQRDGRILLRASNFDFGSENDEGVRGREDRGNASKDTSDARAGEVDFEGGTGGDRKGEGGGRGGAGGGGGEGDEGTSLDWKLPLGSFDSIPGAGSDFSNEEDGPLLEDVDINNGLGEDYDGPDNMEMQQAILSSIADSEGGDPRSASRHGSGDARATMLRLRELVVSCNLT